MPGNVQSYETRTARRGPKNSLLGQRELKVVMWQRTDKNGEIYTELGIEVAPGDVRKWPADLWSKALPVGPKLQRLLLEDRHPELAKRQPMEVTRPKAVTEGPGRGTPPPPAKLPKDFTEGVAQ